MATYECTFKVRGEFLFPLDMLRYDRCFPKTELDAGIIERYQGESESPRGPTEVGLVSVSASKEVCRPNEQRWTSFQWEVVPGSIQVRKI